MSPRPTAPRPPVRPWLRRWAESLLNAASPRPRPSSSSACAAPDPIADPHLSVVGRSSAFFVGERASSTSSSAAARTRSRSATSRSSSACCSRHRPSWWSARCVGTALTLLLDRRLPPIKLVFNLAQFALADVRRGHRRARARRPADDSARGVVGVLVAARSSALAHRRADRRRDLGSPRAGCRRGMLAPDVPHGLVVTRRPTRASRSPPRSLIAVDARRCRCWSCRRSPSSSPTARTRRAPAPRAARVPLRGQPHARALARDRPALEGLLARSLEAFRAELAEIVLFSSDGSRRCAPARPRRATRGHGADRPRRRRRRCAAGRRRARSSRSRPPFGPARCALPRERGVTRRDARDAARRGARRSARSCSPTASASSAASATTT